MTERPILMSAAMVRATLANLKTQHRVAITPLTSTVLGRTPDPSRSALEYPNGWLDLIWENAWTDGHRSDNQPNGLFGCGRNKGKSCGEYLHVPLPDGRSFRIRSKNQPGDRLWVPEKWAPVTHGDYLPISRARRLRSTYDAFVQFASDYPGGSDDYKGHWRSSGSMPKWASRITLEITEVRAQRLQEISNVDAKAEGIEYTAPHRGATCGRANTGIDQCYVCPFINEIWNPINGPRGYGWSANPWVFALSFRRVTA